MSLSRTASRSVAPLLGRLVLAAAFIPLGWEKIMGEEQVYQGSDAKILREIGIGGEPAPAGEAAGLAVAIEGVLARPQQAPGRPDVPLTGTLGSPRVAKPPPAQPPKPEPEPEPEPEPDTIDQGNLAPPKPPAPATTITPVPAPSGRPSSDGGETVRAKAMYRDAVLLTKAGMGPPDMPPWLPVWGARVIAFLQLVGTGLLLVGIFARVWAAGLAVVIVMGFYMTSASVVNGFALTAPMPVDQFNAMFSSLGLFVFSLCLAFTGAGGLSLDGMLFQSGDDGDEHLI